MLLLLDRWPIDGFQKLMVRSKIFLKEGVWLGNWRDVFKDRTIGGSISIPRELVAGLASRGVEFAHNDFSGERKFRTCVVLKDSLCLEWAIEQKRKGNIETLFAGPLVATLPWEIKGLLLSPLIDGLIFFSNWHRDLFLREAQLLREAHPQGTLPTHVWFAGVDSDFWTPASTDIPGVRSILIYDKNPEPELRAAILDELSDRGLPFEILRYGFHSREDYHAALRSSRFAIFLSRSETQGLAMFEAWSTNVPTLHWNPQEMRFLGRAYSGASSCAYLQKDCGLQFQNIAEFPTQLELMLNSQFQPRKTVLRSFTRQHSVDLFLSFLPETARPSAQRSLS